MGVQSLNMETSRFFSYPYSPSSQACNPQKSILHNKAKRKISNITDIKFPQGKHPAWSSYAEARGQ